MKICFSGSVLVASILVSLRVYVFGHEQKWAFQAWHGNGVCGGYTPDFFGSSCMYEAPDYSMSEVRFGGGCFLVGV